MAGEKNYRIVRSEELSSRYESRFVVVDAQAGDLLDDAQGYGYRSKEKAHAVWRYKTRSPAKQERDKTAKDAVRKWCRQHPDIMEDLEDIEFQAAKEGRESEFFAKFVAEYLEEKSFRNLPFTVAELLRFG